MTRDWERSYEHLGDVTGCIRDGIDTLRRTLPRCTQAIDANGKHIGENVQPELDRLLTQMQSLHEQIEKVRSAYFLSHNVQLPTAAPLTSAFPFATLLPEPAV